MTDTNHIDVKDVLNRVFDFHTESYLRVPHSTFLISARARPQHSGVPNLTYWVFTNTVFIETPEVWVGELVIGDRRACQEALERNASYWLANNGHPVEKVADLFSLWEFKTAGSRFQIVSTTLRILTREQTVNFFSGLPSVSDWLSTPE